MNRYFMVLLLGYLAGLFTAPKKGKELREDLKRTVTDLHSMGSEAAAKLVQGGQELASTALPAVQQVEVEGKMLKQEGTEILKNATQLFNESYEKGAAAIEQAEQRIKEKAAPAISLVKDDAIVLKTQGAELVKKASSAFND